MSDSLWEGIEEKLGVKLQYDDILGHFQADWNGSSVTKSNGVDATIAVIDQVVKELQAKVYELNRKIGLGV